MERDILNNNLKLIFSINILRKVINFTYYLYLREEIVESNNKVLQLEVCKLKKSLSESKTQLEELQNLVSNQQEEIKTLLCDMQHRNTLNELTFEEKLDRFNTLNNFKVKHKINKKDASIIMIEIVDVFVEYDNKYLLSSGNLNIDTSQIINMLQLLVIKYSNYYVKLNEQISLRKDKPIEVLDFDFLRKSISNERDIYKTKVAFKLFITPKFSKLMDNMEHVIIQFLKTIYWKCITEDVKVSHILDNILHH